MTINQIHFNLTNRECETDSSQLGNFGHWYRTLFLSFFSSLTLSFYLLPYFSSSIQFSEVLEITSIYPNLTIRERKLAIK